MAERSAAPPGLPAPGELVVVAGFGVSGRAVTEHLVGAGYPVLVTADGIAPELPAELAGRVRSVVDLQQLPMGTALVVTSPGFRPTIGLFRSARAAGVEVICDVELAWRLDRAGALATPAGAARDWLVVTGTNGKTTTVGMLEAILRAAGRRVTASGNVGWPVLSALADRPPQDLVAAELSSFQLHYSPGVRPVAGAVLNVVEDHLDWYAGYADRPGGALAAYTADKATALTGEVAVAVVDDPGAAGLLGRSPASWRIPVTAGEPVSGGLGVRADVLFDLAFGTGALLPASDIRPVGRHNVTNALAAAALALAAGVDGPAVAAGLRAFRPGAHRNVLVAQVGGISYVDDSKATNPHAAAASMLGYPRIVWIAGGQLKGASIDDLIRRTVDRLAGVVVLGVDAPTILAALSRHAPDVPRVHVPGNDHRIMIEVVSAATRLAGRGDTVLLAPAAASLDMFASYAARGHAFAAAVGALAEQR